MINENRINPKCFRTAALICLGAFIFINPCTVAQSEEITSTIGNPLSPFGIGSDNLRSGDLEKWLPEISEIGVSNLRSPRCYYGKVAPAEGKWDWELLDKQIALGNSLKIEYIAMLFGFCKFNTKDAPGYLPLNGIDDWSKYVYELVKHTKGNIKYFEVWNEPPNASHNASPQDYAKLVVASYKAAKEANPDCLVGLAAKSAHINYMDQTIQAGAKDHFDFVTFHPYEVMGRIYRTPGMEPVYMNIVPRVRKMLAAQNPSKANVPIIFTELGCDAKKHGESVQAQALVKAYTMGIAQGVASIQWFEGKDGDNGEIGLMKGNKRRLAFTAYQQLVQAMGKYPKYVGWILLSENKDYGFVFEGAKGSLLITWSRTSKAHKVDFEQAVQILDPETGVTSSASTYSLTLAPIIVSGLPEKLVAEAKTNASLPLPWDGDYTNAKSISITMGEKAEVKGLHIQSGDEIAADVVAYGGSARAGGIPGGNVFIVDPNFLSYTSVPIEITALVRRNDANAPATLSLEYESTSGNKKAPDFSIPEGKEWQKASWKITDAQFVSMWGFNFKFNTGTHSIQNVTVTKLD